MKKWLFGFMAGKFVGDDIQIPEPYGKPLTAYGECFEVLDRLTGELADKLNSLVEDRR